jgi:hypothetical protein
MKNIVYVIVIFFWILSMISKSKRQKQQAAERERIPNLNKRVGNRMETEPKKAARFSDEVTGVFTKQEKKETATDYESAYASSDYTDAQKSAPVTEDTGSHYRKNYGMTSSLGTESSEEKDAYNKEQKVIPKFSFGDNSIKQYVIASEILGKPKALRR